MIPNGLARFEQRVPDRQRVGPVEEQLEAVLAGVAGARDERRLAARVALGDGVVLERGQVDVRQRPEQLRRTRALDGDERRPQRSIVERRVVAGQPLAQLVDDDLAVRRVGHDHEAVRGDAVDDQVVDDPAVGRADHAVVRATLGQPRRIADERSGEARAAPGPLTQTSPMCERSNRPTRSRTARCSSRMPEYWTGISQPAKSMSRRRARGDARRARSAARWCLYWQALEAGERQRLLDQLALGRKGQQRRAPRATGTQRTSSNSWSCSSRLPPIGSIRKKWTVLWMRSPSWVKK